MRQIFFDIVLLSGLGLIVYGTFLLSPPISIIVGGLFLAFIALLASKNIDSK